MAPAQKPSAQLKLDAHCFRLSAKGRAFVHVVETRKQTVGSLSRHMYDVLMLCGTGAWFDQLRQFMPQHSLEDSLQALLSLELIEVVQPPEAPARPSPALGRPRLAR